ncbi:hypothetical protein DFH06DRAFT_1131982 [Mycena polygramma]|nr:hypothetical protein DFH06DRAFT_1131982 [Mycena polygramma]
MSGDYNPQPSAQVIPRETMAKVGYSPMVLDGMYHRREYETATRKESTWTTIGKAAKAFLTKLRDRAIGVMNVDPAAMELPADLYWRLRGSGSIDLSRRPRADFRATGLSSADRAPTTVAISSAPLGDDQSTSRNPPDRRRTGSCTGKTSISQGEVSLNASGRMHGARPTRLLGGVANASGAELAARSKREARTMHQHRCHRSRRLSAPNLSQVSLLRSAAAARLSSRKSRGTSRQVSIRKDSQKRVGQEGWGGAAGRSASDSLVSERRGLGVAAVVNGKSPVLTR